jgi:hypothetical protein|nr:MAG TPA: hypothetical protein [Caudoviricetes sp.]
MEIIYIFIKGDFTMKKNLLMKLLLFTFTICLSLTFSTKAFAAKKTTISTKKVYILVGRTSKITIKNATKKVKWTSSNKKVKIVKKKGKKNSSITIKGLHPGKTIIKAKIGKKKLSCKVYIKDYCKAYKNTSSTLKKYGSYNRINKCYYLENTVYSENTTDVHSIEYYPFKHILQISTVTYDLDGNNISNTLLALPCIKNGDCEVAYYDYSHGGSYYVQGYINSSYFNSTHGFVHSKHNMPTEKLAYLSDSITTYTILMQLVEFDYIMQPYNISAHQFGFSNYSDQY